MRSLLFCVTAVFWAHPQSSAHDDNEPWSGSAFLHVVLFALIASWDASSNTFIPQFQRSYIPQVALNVNLNLYFEYLSPKLRLRFPICVSFPKGRSNYYPAIFPCSLLGTIQHWAQGSLLYLAPYRSVFKWKLSCFHIPGTSQSPQGSFNFVLISLPLNRNSPFFSDTGQQHLSIWKIFT